MFAIIFLWRRIREAFHVKSSEKYRQNLVVYELYISIGLKKSYRSSSIFYPHTVAHLCNQFNHVFAVLISMPRFKSNKFCKTRSKIKLLLQNLRMLGALPPDLQWLPAAGGCPHTKKHYSLVAIFWLCPWLVVSTRNANELHQNFSSITSAKE